MLQVRTAAPRRSPPRQAATVCPSLSAVSLASSLPPGPSCRPRRDRPACLRTAGTRCGWGEPEPGDALQPAERPAPLSRSPSLSPLQASSQLSRGSAAAPRGVLHTFSQSSKLQNAAAALVGKGGRHSDRAAGAGKGSAPSNWKKTALGTGGCVSPRLTPAPPSAARARRGPGSVAVCCRSRGPGPAAGPAAEAGFEEPPGNGREPRVGPAACQVPLTAAGHCACPC